MISRRRLDMDAVASLLADAMGGRGKIKSASALVAASVLAAVRESAKVTFGTNHSWPLIPANWTPRLTLNQLKLCTARATAHAKWIASKHKPSAHSMIIMGDSLTIEPYSGQKHHLVITSPPYLSRLDYVRFLRPEFELLEALELVSEDEVRKSQLGSVLTETASSGQDSDLPSFCENLLRRIHDHPSKASSTYYHLFFTAYLRGLMKFAKTLKEVTDSSAVGWIVIQDSWYKDIYISTADILGGMLETQGWRVQAKWPFEVKASLSNLSGVTAEWRSTSPLVEWVLKVRRGERAS